MLNSLSDTIIIRMRMEWSSSFIKKSITIAHNLATEWFCLCKLSFDSVSQKEMTFPIVESL